MTKLTRKEFLKATKSFLTLIGLGAIAGPVVAYFYPTELEEMPSELVPVGKPEDIPVGTSQTVRFGRYPALVIHTENGFRAYSAVCTHFACITQYDEELGQIVCHCHDGLFDPLDGSVIAGPPPEPLLALELTEADGVLYIGVGGEA
jgi:Rieske Fe-S protein